MSLLLCSVCDTQFDTDIQVEADYDTPLCEDCLNEQEEAFRQWWQSLDADELWIHENSQ